MRSARRACSSWPSRSSTAVKKMSTLEANGRMWPLTRPTSAHAHRSARILCAGCSEYFLSSCTQSDRKCSASIAAVRARRCRLFSGPSDRLDSKLRWDAHASSPKRDASSSSCEAGCFRKMRSVSMLRRSTSNSMVGSRLSTTSDRSAVGLCSSPRLQMRCMMILSRRYFMRSRAFSASSSSPGSCLPRKTKASSGAWLRMSK
mmetsp:Transcript_6558/g.26706  ORF Transcript_6558/g.26706 Transcript_6558/m.26706 type:complete len:203 (-) Transcript_6558:894-1502(-)